MAETPLNPYEFTPALQDSEPRDPSAPAYQLFSISSIMLAAFLGSLAAGGLLLAINYARLGRTAVGAFWGITLLLITVVIMWVAMELPDEVPAVAFLVPQLVVMYVVASAFQARQIAVHERSGGKLASNWAAAGIGLLAALILVVGIFGFVFLDQDAWGTRMDFGKHDEIYYSQDATEADARALGAILLEELYFGEPPGTTVLVSKSNGQFKISFVLQDGAWHEALTVESFRDLGVILANKRFGRPLTVDLCDEYVDSQKKLLIE